MLKSTILVIGVSALAAGAILTQAFPQSTSEVDDGFFWDGPCWGYQRFGTSSGDDVISALQIREVARKGSFDLCISRGSPNMNHPDDLDFLTEPQQHFEFLKTVFASDELNRLLLTVPEIDQFNKWFALPKEALQWSTLPSASDVEARISEGASDAYQKVLRSAKFNGLGGSRSASGLAMVVRKVPIFPGKAYDLFFAFGKKTCYRFQVLPMGPVVFSGSVPLPRPAASE